MQCLEALERNDNPAPCTADAGIRPAGFNAANAAEPLMHEVIQRKTCALFLAFEIKDRGGRNTTEQKARRVILRIAADLADAPSHARERGGYICSCRGLADAALAVEGNFLHRITLLHSRKKLMPRLFELVAVENPRRLLNTIHNVLREIVDVARPRMPDLPLPHGGHLRK